MQKSPASDSELTACQMQKKNTYLEKLIIDGDSNISSFFFLPQRTFRGFNLVRIVLQKQR